MNYGKRMQDKTCPTCNETYFTFIDYCFRDGSKLVLPGEKQEVEETEMLTQTRRVTPVESVTPKSSDDMTTPLGLNIEKPQNITEGEIIDEDLEGPLALGNTQMLRKEDLMAMFQDDSTYNGELIDPEDDAIELGSDGDTEDMEATETFDLTNRSVEEKTEFEQAPPTPTIEHVAIASAPTPVVVVEARPTEPVQEPSPAPQPQVYEEKEPSVSPLFLMGGLLGLLCVVVGFVLSYQNQSPNTEQVSASKQEVSLPTKEKEAEIPPKEEAAPVVEEIVETNNSDEEVQNEEVEVIPDTPVEDTENNPMLQLKVMVGSKLIPIELSESITEDDLIVKLQEKGIEIQKGKSMSLTFFKGDSVQVVQLPIPASTPFIDFSFGEEE